MADNRFVNNTLSQFHEVNRSSIFGYEDALVLTLEEAVEKILPPIPRAMEYVATAKKKYNRHSDLLTRDESAAIYLYSMPTSFFSSLNSALRAEDRHSLKSWFAFLKLFIAALKKLPSTKATVWRGVNYDDTLSFVDNDVHVWWSINSCSMDPSVAQRYLGQDGTLFTIDTVDGKDISSFSAIPDDKEVILMPGTRVRRRYETLNYMDRLFVIHLEEINPQNQSQTELNYLFQRVKKKYQRNSRMQRLMNPSESFPIEQSYINLAIVKEKEQQEKEKQLRSAQHSDTIIGAFEEIYGMKTAIDIKSIFDTCKTREKQILVFGRAGIGKSTFCRYITYQWATYSYWSQYELLAFIPLRRLTAYRYPPLPPGHKYSLVDLVKKEVFNADLSEKDNMLLDKQFDSINTLWVLDGYDEIMQNVPPHLEDLFEQLLDTPHHILSSRPYMNTLSYSVKMEITGFTDENIEEYIRQFFDQMKDDLDDASTKSEKLLRFLKSNPSIWGVAHIPINLELICSCWSNEDWSETEQLIITTLYSMMTEWLCRRYLSAKNVQIQNVSKKELHGRCQKELAFLEYLAFNAMEHNTIIIGPTLLEKALDEAKVSSQDHQNVLNIGILKSFNKQGTGTQIESSKDHYFIHLSFQEYFAARYLIKTLNTSSNRTAIEFIKRQKYNQRYALLFIFASGLLNESDMKPCLNIFWDAIFAEPRDLVGIRHIQLIISCIEEMIDTSIIPRHSQLLECIAKCIEYNITTKNGIICEYLSQSLQRAQSVTCHETIITTLINLLRSNDIDMTIEVLSFISALNISNPSPALVTSLVTTFEDENVNVRRSACGALGSIGKKGAANQVISKLVSALGDKNESVRVNAAVALGNVWEKGATNEVISQLVSALGDENKDIRKSACIALGSIGEKGATHEVITKLVSALGDENENIRWGACRALRSVGVKGATNEVISKLVSVLGDENHNVRWSASTALGRLGEKGATHEVISKLVSALEDKNKTVRCGVCEALGSIGVKGVTHEVIGKLVSALDDENEYVRGSACSALGSIGEKGATHEVISKLVSALDDEKENVRWSAYGALGNIGEKGATNEVISKLVSALDDENEYIRGTACVALGQMGEKTVTDEIISKIVSALGDENEVVKRNACLALGMIGEQAATNETISKLVNTLDDENESVRVNAYSALGRMGKKAATNEVISQLILVSATDTAGNILSSFTAITQLSPKIILDLCLHKYSSGFLKNISGEQLINYFLTSQNLDWLPALTRLTFTKGFAMTATADKVVLYGRSEPLEVRIPSLQLHRQLIAALTGQAKRLHLFFEITSEDHKKS